MGITTKVVVEVTCDYPGCKEVVHGQSFDFATFKGWSYETTTATLKALGWNVVIDNDKEIVLCKEHNNITTYIREYIP